ncbi:MAG TPA: hypothetical protein PLP29_16435, partial [Candidatus Ozemobacteraceae bacterium]|nr:hypothetical protein [Candidatus Ozemobacteraceae bacterium]
STREKGRCGMCMVRVVMNGVGKVVDVAGVPEKYSKYYKTSLLEFAGRPIGVGESWANRSTIPVCIDPESEAILCEALATFTLATVDRSADRASITFTSSYNNAPGQATGTGKIHGSSEGAVVVKLSDGSPVESRAVSASRLDFGGGNAIEMEQRIRTRMAESR